MGIREEVKSGQLSSRAALSLAGSFDFPAPELEGWLRRRIARNADEEEEAARVKAAEKKEAEAKKPRKPVDVRRSRR